MRLSSPLAFAAIIGVLKMNSTPDQVAIQTKEQPAKPVETGRGEVATAGPAQPTVQPIEKISTPPTKAPTIVTPRKEYKGVAVSTAPKPPEVKLIPGERSYLQAIARLDSTIKSNQKDMRPALQSEYQRNLAVVDRAIAATRSAAKSNPNDPDAADFMFAAYQSKVDLLNTIADARVGGGRGH